MLKNNVPSFRRETCRSQFWHSIFMIFGKSSTCWLTLSFSVIATFDYCSLQMIVVSRCEHWATSGCGIFGKGTWLGQCLTVLVTIILCSLQNMSWRLAQRIQTQPTQKSTLKQTCLTSLNQFCSRRQAPASHWLKDSTWPPSPEWCYRPCGTQSRGLQESDLPLPSLFSNPSRGNLEASCFALLFQTYPMGNQTAENASWISSLTLTINWNP